MTDSSADLSKRSMGVAVRDDGLDFRRCGGSVAGGSDGSVGVDVFSGGGDGDVSDRDGCFSGIQKSISI